MAKRTKRPSRLDSLTATVAHEHKDLSTSEISRKQTMLFAEAEVLDYEVKEHTDALSKAKKRMTEIEAELSGLRVVMERR